jgi:hypothetical protein
MVRGGCGGQGVVRYLKLSNLKHLNLISKRIHMSGALASDIEALLRIFLPDPEVLSNKEFIKTIR